MKKMKVKNLFSLKETIAGLENVLKDFSKRCKLTHNSRGTVSVRKVEDCRSLVDPLCPNYGRRNDFKVFCF